MGRVRALWFAAALLLPGAAPGAAGDEGKPAPEKPAATNVADADAAAALERFEREFDTPDLDLRLDALERVRKVLHPKVVDRLLALALKHEEFLIRAGAFKGLAMQTPSAKIIGPRVTQFLAAEAEALRKAKNRGDIGLLLDPRTGDAVLDTPEGMAAMRKKRERGRMLAEAVRCISTLDYRARDTVETLREFLQESNDDLVALALEVFGRWKEWTVLPAMRDLFDMYPDENAPPVAAVRVDTGAAGNEDAQAAKRKWNALYGDPDKRRARPKVVRALRKALTDITGETFETPEALREYMKRPEVKRRVKG